jgi:hypothetical protein
MVNAGGNPLIVTDDADGSVGAVGGDGVGFAQAPRPRSSKANGTIAGLDVIRQSLCCCCPTTGPVVRPQQHIRVDG